uniref:Uncharacterized protein n=1 Tax=Arundo donax TaxID=35708 RepID=A0A0A8ZPF8_ARUDO
MWLTNYLCFCYILGQPCRPCYDDYVKLVRSCASSNL